MAALPLSQTVDASVARRSWRSSVLSVMTSTFLQGGVILGLVVVPLVAMQAPPLPRNAVSFHSFVPVVPPPPPPPPPRGEGPRRASTVDPARLLDKMAIAPLEPPDGILEEVDIFGDDLTGGMPDGVVGGVPGMPLAQPIVTVPERGEQAPVGPIEVGRGIKPPEKRHHVRPEYPKVAIAARVSGVVEIRAIIDEAGSVVNLMVTKSIPLLDKAALDAVRQWRYEPTYLNGRAVPITMTVSVTFTLSK